MAMADSLHSEHADWLSTFDLPLQADDLLSPLHDVPAIDFSDLLPSPATSFECNVMLPAMDYSLSLSDFFQSEASHFWQDMTIAAESVNPSDCIKEPQGLDPELGDRGAPSIEQVLPLADGMPSDLESGLADRLFDKSDLETTPDLHENPPLMMASESSTGSSESMSMARSAAAPFSRCTLAPAPIPSFSADDRKQEYVPEAHGTSVDTSQKKQLRLRRNRELAFESRQRKKSYIKDLETKCKRLEQERNRLQQQTSFICTENSMLKEEVTRLKKMKGSNGVAEPAVLEDSLPSEFLLHLTCLSLMAWVSLFGSPLLALLTGAFLQSFKVMEGGLAKERAHSNSYAHQSDILARGFYAPDIQLLMHAFASSMEQRAHSFWRRRIRLFVCVSWKTDGHLVY